jgi:hypothetical protein
MYELLVIRFKIASAIWLAPQLAVPLFWRELGTKDSESSVYPVFKDLHKIFLLIGSGISKQKIVYNQQISHAVLPEEFTYVSFYSGQRKIA